MLPRERVREPFLLLESDLVYEPRALTTLLAQHPSVTAAYLCRMSTGGSVEPPTLVVGLVAEEGRRLPLRDRLALHEHALLLALDGEREQGHSDREPRP